MSAIQVLPRHVADVIAAGEVVERPASVCKELLENSIDAGAGRVTVEIERGGVSLLRVSDDGCGMSPEDAEQCFLRHATSKIRDASDLETVLSYGFRGEALAAISAVSRVELCTRRDCDELGFFTVMEAGEKQESGTRGAVQGTSFTVRDLFYNTPARQKFLKRDATEAAYVTEVVHKAALSSPSVSFRLLRDGKEELRTPGDGNLRSCIYQLYGRELEQSLIELSFCENGISVSGFVCRPEFTRGNRAMQFFFVGRRPVRSRTMSSVLDEAYKGMITSGRFPVCFIRVDGGFVDVNVHPAKTEVKFQDERAVFSVVYAAIRNALQHNTQRPVIQPTITTVPAEATAAQKPNTWSAVRSAVLPEKPKFEPKAEQELKTEPEPVEIEAITPQAITPQAVKPQEITPEPIVETRQTEIAEIRKDDGRFVGEVFGGYLLAECGEELLLIDKHAAHERVLYEKLRLQNGHAESQLLLAPLRAELPARDCELLLGETGLLETLGFELEQFGRTTLLVRAVPSVIEAGDSAAVLGELAEKLRLGTGRLSETLFDSILHVIACKAAVKLGTVGSAVENERLVRMVLDNPELRHCPHGRPVAVSIRLRDLEKRFLRQ